MGTAFLLHRRTYVRPHVLFHKHKFEISGVRVSGNTTVVILQLSWRYSLNNTFKYFDIHVGCSWLLILWFSS